MNDETHLFQSLQFLLSPPHPCSYLSDQEASTLFVDPKANMDMMTYQRLSRAGFRRSGEYVYRPHCQACNKCVPVRIPVAQFSPNRSQRRSWKKNQDLQLRVLDAAYQDEHFALYRRYMQARHPGGGMDNEDPDAYRRVISAQWSESSLFEFRLNGTLLAVAVVDVGIDGLSAVYTFFAPEAAHRSLGCFAVLSQVAEARQRDLHWVYLGYWNQDSPKMAYKTDYHPLEYFDGQQWGAQVPSCKISVNSF